MNQRKKRKQRKKDSFLKNKENVLYLHKEREEAYRLDRPLFDSKDVTILKNLLKHSKNRYTIKSVWLS